MVNGITKEPILNEIGAWKQNLADGLSSEVWKGYRVTVGSLLLVVGVISAIAMIIYALRKNFTSPLEQKKDLNKSTTTTDTSNEQKENLNKSTTTIGTSNEQKENLNKSTTTIGTDIIQKTKPESPLEDIEEAIKYGDVEALKQKKFDIHACGKTGMPYIIFAILNASTTKTDTALKNAASQVVKELALKDTEENWVKNMEKYPAWQRQHVIDMNNGERMAGWYPRNDQGEELFKIEPHWYPTSLCHK